jgi:hypothetical protein
MSLLHSPSWRGLQLAGAAVALLLPVTTSAEVPILNSDYSAPHVIYLDFDGHDEPASEYTCPGGGPEGWSIAVSASDVSADVTATLVREIWEAVAEDFAPFRVNVTTDPTREPGPTSVNAIRVAIGVLSPLEGLGYSPAICESDSLAHPPYLNPRISDVSIVKLDPSKAVSAKDVAKRISHEAGHLYGLVHHVASPGVFDGWIMSGQLPASRHVWRNGKNEFGQTQNDVEQLALLLGRRADETNPANFKSFITTNPNVSGLYIHGTIAEANDWDDFRFAVGGAGPITFQLSAGIWTNPLAPVVGTEPNARYRLEVRSGDGRFLLACPEAWTFTLAATHQPSAPGANCVTAPASLLVGETYRVRVVRHSTSSLPGNVGRYTVVVRGAPQGPPNPPIMPVP